MAPAERADVIVDFSNFKPGDMITVLNNLGPDEPYQGGQPGPISLLLTPTPPARCCSSASIPLASTDTSTPPAQLSLPAAFAGRRGQHSAGEPERAGVERRQRLRRTSRQHSPQPRWAIPSGRPGAARYPATLTAPGTRCCGTTPSRRCRCWAPPRSGRFTTTPPMPTPSTCTWWPSRWSTGRTSKGNHRSAALGDGLQGHRASLFPGQITRIKAKFDIAGLYVWHCHIISHEDNEMMRPYEVVQPLAQVSFPDVPRPPTLHRHHLPGRSRDGHVGYDIGTFGPSDPLLRAQLAKIADPGSRQAYDSHHQPRAATFPDVATPASPTRSTSSRKRRSRE